MKNNETNVWENKVYSGLRFVWYAGAELIDGIRKNRIDVVRFIYPGVFVAVMLLFRIDHAVAYLTGCEYFKLSSPLREALSYAALASGWVIWATLRGHYRATFLNKLQQAFSYCGLIANGRFPSFIDDQPVDDYVRRMRLGTQGIPLTKFQECKEQLESQFNISVVKIAHESGDKSRIDILYAMKPLAELAILEGVATYKEGEIPIGVSHEGPISVNLKEAPHMLVTGQTTGGKSNFEKVVASTLVETCPDADIYYLDFKGGMEIADLTNKLGTEHSNFFLYEDKAACARFLGQLGDTLEGRFKEIARLGAANLDDYLKKLEVERLKKKISGHSPSNRDETPRRMYLIIDEIAELYSRNAALPKAELVAARAAVNRIARQGRAAGMHMVAAMQTPDANSFDQTLKANMPAVLCFPMTTIPASISALGTKRAVDLDPAIKGRAVWKYGPKTLEVQTYLFQ